MGVGGLLLAVLATVGSWWFPTVPAASAHAVLVSSSPADDQVVTAAPTEVTLSFTEQVEATDGGVDVIAPSGRHVARTSALTGSSTNRLAVPVKADEQGTYTVVYRVISADGHPVAGSFIYHVGVRSGVGVGQAELARVDNAGGVLGIVGWIGRGLSYGGLLVTLGVMFGLGRLVAVGFSDRGGVEARLVGRWGIATVAAVLAAVGAVLIEVARASAVSGLRVDRALGRLPSLVSTARVLRFDLARLVASIVIAACCALVPRPRWSGRWLGAVVGLLSFGALATSSFSGHASTASPVGVTIALDLVHMLTAAMWLGGLFVVLAVARVDGEDRSVGRDFSRRASLVFPVVVLTGGATALFHVDSLSLLFATTYGRLLLAKVLGVVLVAVLAWINRGLLADLTASAERRIAALVMERDVALAVIAVTSVLVFSAPAIDYATAATSDGYDVTRTTGDSAVRLELSPALVGDNSIRLSFADGAGRPQAVDAAVVDISTAGIPPRKVPLELGDGRSASASLVAFGTAGTWTVTVRTVALGLSRTTRFVVRIR